MRRMRVCIFLFASVLIALPLLASQAEQPTENSKTAEKVEKKAKKKGKRAEQSGEPAGQAKTPATGSAHRAAPAVSESEIAAARASGKVWVNTETGIYHKGGRWYGATKQGKFMTEEEAIKSGYRASKRK